MPLVWESINPMSDLLFIIIYQEILKPIIKKQVVLDVMEKKVNAILLFSQQDIQLQKFLIEETNLNFEKREQEYHKLNQMIMYCHTEECLQSYIIRYFDQTSHVITL